ncbi:MAG: hypothetical protein MZV64_12005 [Ignavibacteriales bacterium]|nr:hypothetical protein [Ignavibacteriales bacterium]
MSGSRSATARPERRSRGRSRILVPQPSGGGSRRAECQYQRPMMNSADGFFMSNSSSSIPPAGSFTCDTSSRPIRRQG